MNRKSEYYPKDINMHKKGLVPNVNLGLHMKVPIGFTLVRFYPGIIGDFNISL